MNANACWESLIFLMELMWAQWWLWWERKRGEKTDKKLLSQNMSVQATSCQLDSPYQVGLARLTRGERMRFLSPAPSRAYAWCSSYFVPCGYRSGGAVQTKGSTKVCVWTASFVNVCMCVLSDKRHMKEWMEWEALRSFRLAVTVDGIWPSEDKWMCVRAWMRCGFIQTTLPLWHPLNCLSDRL